MKFSASRDWMSQQPFVFMEQATSPSITRMQTVQKFYAHMQKWQTRLVWANTWNLLLIWFTIYESFGCWTVVWDTYDNLPMLAFSDFDTIHSFLMGTFSSFWWHWWLRVNDLEQPKNMIQVKASWVTLSIKWCSETLCINGFQQLSPTVYQWSLHIHMSLDFTLSDSNFHMSLKENIKCSKDWAEVRNRDQYTECGSSSSMKNI